MGYLINENLSSTIVTYVVLKKLTKPWAEWDACQLGIIDDQGNKLKTPVTSEEREAWTVLDRFVCNVKRIMSKFIGQSRLAFMLSAAYLLKDSVKYYVNSHQTILKEDLTNLTYQKQLIMLDLIKELDNSYIIRESKNEMEYNIILFANKIEKILEEKKITSIEEFL
jgi:hypothetical protein